MNHRSFDLRLRFIADNSVRQMSPDGIDELGPVAKALLLALADSGVKELLRRHADDSADATSWWLDLPLGGQVVVEDRSQWKKPTYSLVTVTAIGEPNIELQTDRGRVIAFSFGDFRYRLLKFNSEIWRKVTSCEKTIRQQESESKALKKDRREAFQSELRELQSRKSDFRFGIYPSWTVAQEGLSVICVIGKQPFETYRRGFVIRVRTTTSEIFDLHSGSAEMLKRNGAEIASRVRNGLARVVPDTGGLIRFTGDFYILEGFPFIARNGNMIHNTPGTWETLQALTNRIDEASSRIAEFKRLRSSLLTTLVPLQDSVA